MAKKLVQNAIDLSVSVRIARAEEDASLLVKADGRLETALALWAKGIKNRRAKSKLPSWWKDATGSL